MSHRGGRPGGAAAGDDTEGAGEVLAHLKRNSFSKISPGGTGGMIVSVITASSW